MTSEDDGEEPCEGENDEEGRTVEKDAHGREAGGMEAAEDCAGKHDIKTEESKAKLETVKGEKVEHQVEQEAKAGEVAIELTQTREGSRSALPLRSDAPSCKRERCCRLALQIKSAIRSCVAAGLLDVSVARRASLRILLLLAGINEGFEESTSFDPLVSREDQDAPADEALGGRGALLEVTVVRCQGTRGDSAEKHSGSNISGQCPVVASSAAGFTPASSSSSTVKASPEWVLRGFPGTLEQFFCGGRGEMSAQPPHLAVLAYPLRAHGDCGGGFDTWYFDWAIALPALADLRVLVVTVGLGRSSSAIAPAQANENAEVAERVLRCLGCAVSCLPGAATMDLGHTAVEHTCGCPACAVPADGACGSGTSMTGVGIKGRGLGVGGGGDGDGGGSARREEGVSGHPELCRRCVCFRGWDSRCRPLQDARGQQVSPIGWAHTCHVPLRRQLSTNLNYDFRPQFQVSGNCVGGGSASSCINSPSTATATTLPVTERRRRRVEAVASAAGEAARLAWQAVAPPSSAGLAAAAAAGFAAGEVASSAGWDGADSRQHILWAVVGAAVRAVRHASASVIGDGARGGETDSCEDATAAAVGTLLGMKEGIFSYEGKSLEVFAAELCDWIVAGLVRLEPPLFARLSQQARRQRLQDLVRVGGLERPGECVIALCQGVAGVRNSGGEVDKEQRFRAVRLVLQRVAALVIGEAFKPNLVSPSGPVVQGFLTAADEFLNLAKVRGVVNGKKSSCTSLGEL
eukprot:TRINITY_DN26832_c1_g1_i1.p1 TRINITY_DN26832_c1_g1~~TRINITY_DN26832_c1_g1_i1.p1  ORF type:complete len:853 (-),score=157.97 TRINITY_DN26832_c1_g1_i1:405-2648(-)